MTVKQAGGVVVMGNRVVLRRTAKGEYLFPKGHIEVGETAEQAALREVAEETGLEARIVASLGEVSFSYQGEEYQVALFLMQVVRELPQWQDHQGRDAVAVPREKVAELLSFDNYRQIWARALRILQPGSAAS